MKAVLSNGDHVKIQFKHMQFKPTIHDREHGKWGWIKATTICRVIHESKDRDVEVDVIPPGYARCAAGDQFVLETGRQVALHHLLGYDKRFGLYDPRQKLVLTPTDTGIVLAAYYGRKRG